MTLVLALLLAAPTRTPSPAKDPARAVARRVHTFYAQTADFSASFRQQYTYVALGRIEDSEGIVQVKKPGRVRWDYAKPDRRTLYLEGRTLWIWRPDDQEAQVKRDFGGDQLSSAFTFLWGKGDLLKEFSPRTVPAPAGLPAGDALELTPLKPTPGVQKLLFVVGKDGQVLASVVTNPQGDVNRIVFSEAKVNQGLPDSLFHFAPPQGAYVQEF
jgi:outer membrane lipoprotein carrier protein